jgi:pimeloyl-ACP methyl ester carboxylesterase
MALHRTVTRTSLGAGRVPYTRGMRRMRGGQQWLGTGKRHPLVPAYVGSTRYPRLRTSGGVAVGVEILPRARRDPVPLVFLPGWGQTARTYALPLRTFAARGRYVVSMFQPARGRPIVGQSDLPPEEVRKAQGVIGVLARLRQERVDLVAHSEGALAAVIATALYPQRVRNLVLVDPAGLIVRDRWYRLAGRFGQMIVQCTLEAATNADERRALVWAMLNPTVYALTHPLRALAQIGALTRWHSLDLLRGLRDSEVGVVMITGVDNRVFPIDQAGPLVHEGVSLVDGFHAVRGGHAKLLGDARYAAAVLDAIDRLNARRTRRTTALAGADAAPATDAPASASPGPVR